MPAPQSTQVKNAKPGGVLPISITNGKAQQNANGVLTQPFRSSPSKLKVVIRRLPPGLTRDEYEQSMGPDWKTGSSNVGWMFFKAGKTSKEYASQFLEDNISLGLD